MNVATFPPASLTVQLAELEREKKMRAGVYPHWIATRKITERAAAYQNNALDGAIATIKRLADAQARGEPGRNELIKQLRNARKFIFDLGLVVPAELDELLAKVPE